MNTNKTSFLARHTDPLQKILPDNPEPLVVTVAHNWYMKPTLHCLPETVSGAYLRSKIREDNAFTVAQKKIDFSQPAQFNIMQAYLDLLYALETQVFKFFAKIVEAGYLFQVPVYTGKEQGYIQQHTIQQEFTELEYLLRKTGVKLRERYAI